MAVVVAMVAITWHLASRPRPHQGKAQALDQRPPTPEDRDLRRLQVATRLASTDPAAAMVLLREVESPDALRGWARVALELLEPGSSLDPPSHRRTTMPGSVRALATRPPGTLAVVGTDAGIAVLDAATSEPARAPEPERTTMLQAVALNADGKWAAAAEPGGRVVLWQPGGSEHYEVAAALEQVWAIGISASGRRLAVGDGTGALRVWSRDEGGPSLAAALDVGEAMVRALAWLDDGTLLVGDQSGRLLRWSASSLALETIEDELEAIAEIVISPEPRTFATLHVDGLVRRWSAGPSGRPSLDRRLQCSNDLMVSLGFVGGRLAGISRHGGVFDWPDPSSEHCRRRAALLTDEVVTRAAFADDGRVVLTANASEPELHRWTIDAYASDPKRLHERLWTATDECLSVAQRMELLGDDRGTASAEHQRCRDRVAGALGLRP